MDGRRSRAAWLGASVASLLGWSIGCGAAGDPAGELGGAVGPGVGGGGVPGPDGDLALCDPPCTPAEFCSVTGQCLATGTCGADGDCAAGLFCDGPSARCVPGGNCGAAEVSVEPVAPSMLIVLDRSCSMQDEVGGSSKWAIAVAALTQMTTDYAGQIHFGLTLFPDVAPPKCAQGAVPLPVAANQAPAIQALLQASLGATDPHFPDGPCVTNIDTAMAQAAAEPSLAAGGGPAFVLLVTDGKQYDCSEAGGDAGTLGIITDLRAHRAVPTFVVGFGDEVDPAQLNLFALAGGLPSGDPQTSYYRAEDQPTLAAALATIADQTLGCTIALDESPEDPAAIYVFFDDDPQGLARDPSHASGWDYDPAANQVTFYGAACDSLQSGEVTDVDVVFGCASPTAE